MKQSTDKLREGLLSSESWDQTQHAEFEQAVAQMVHKPLSRFQQISFAVIAVIVGALGIVQLAVAALTTQLPTPIRFGLAGLTLFNFAAVILLVIIVRVGSMNLRRDPGLQAGLMWFFSVLLSVFFLMIIPQIPAQHVGYAITMLGISLVALISTGLMLLRTCIEQSELNTHQRLLELTIHMQRHDEEET